MNSEIKDISKGNFEKVRGLRRHFHAHPELSFKEHETSKYIAHFLTEMAIEYKSGLGGGTGIIADIGHGDNMIALRADIDALPILEKNTCDYASKNHGVMHACGHDVHTSSLLGTLLIINKLKHRLPGKVRFLFQPGEELLPGGASLMIRDAALQNPSVGAIYGQHVHPDLAVGKIGYKSGEAMASADELYITIIGKGGHAAAPERTIDPIIVAAQVISSLQTLVSRNADPKIPSVLSIGQINSDGGATNIIPGKVFMKGTFRTFDEVWRLKAHELIKQQIVNICQAYGATCEVDIKVGYPVLKNDVNLTNQSAGWMKEYMGAENVVELPARLSSEDFSYYSHKVPACFYRLGTSSSNGDHTAGVHTPTFDINEKALLHSTGLMAWLAYKYLEQRA